MNIPKFIAIRLQDDRRDDYPVVLKMNEDWIVLSENNLKIEGY